jgi:hypothetical protein
MGRIVAFVLGGLALALYGPHLFMDDVSSYEGWWRERLGASWYAKIFSYGPGIFAGLALVLHAVRGRDATSP